MAQKYVIYINDKTLFITRNAPKLVDKIQQIEEESFNFTVFCKNIKRSNVKNYFILTKQPKATFRAIKDSLVSIKAAGGLAANKYGELLFIFRNGKWDLPKGKVEKGEKVKIAAVREVEEECGVEIEKRNERICKTYHVYVMNEELILKTTSWYAMDVKGNPKLVPQTEEGITEAVWVNPNNVVEKTENTYPAIIDVLKRAGII
jgi:8-oxo-dGTP pyrophosphatase MutT (NUDIX family)